jgi:phosphoglucomutase
MNDDIQYRLIRSLIYKCYFSRYDYENVDSKGADQMMADLEAFISDPSSVGRTYSEGGKTFSVAKTDNFEYTDPIDGSVSKKQVNCIDFLLIKR